MTAGDHENAETLDEFRAVFENSQIGIMFLKEYRLLYKSNKRLADIMGYDSPEEMAGISMRQIHLSEELYLEYGEKYYKPLTQGVQIQVEYQLRRKDGSPVWCSLSGKAIDSNNPPDLSKGVIWCVDDISRRKAAVAEVIAQRDTLGKIFENVPYIMMLVNREGRVTGINKRGAAFFSGSEDDIPGGLLGEMFGCLHSFHDRRWEKSPEFSDCPILNHVAHTFETGQSLHDLEERMTVRRGEADLTFVLLLSTVLLRDEDGDRVLVTLNDITERRLAEEMVSREKEEWEQTFNAVPDLIAIMDCRHRVVRVNLAMATRLGLTPEKCIGARCHAVVHGTQAPPDFCPHVLTCRDSLEHIAEVHEPRLGGDFLVSTTPTFDGQGQMIGSVHVARDITERKRLEEALRESERTLERILAASPVGIAFVAGPDRNLRWVNESWLQLFGYDTPEEVKDLSFKSLYVSEEEFRRVGSLISSFCPNGEPAVADTILRRKNGETFDAHLRVNSFDPADMSKGYVWIGQDISEIKKAQRKLLESELIFRSLFENSMEGIFFGAPDGRILMANPTMCKILGMTEEEICAVGREGVLDTTHPQYATVLREREENGCIRKEINFKSGDGKLIPVELTSKIFKYSETETRSMTVVRDITERKQAEAASRLAADKLRVGEARLRRAERAARIGHWEFILGSGKVYGVLRPNRRNLSKRAKSSATPSQYQPKWFLNQSVSVCRETRNVPKNGCAAMQRARFV